MAESLADAVLRKSQQAVDQEMELISALVAGYIAETGCAPMLVQTAEGAVWCDPDPAGDVSRVAGHGGARLAALYAAQTSIPATRARLVRVLDVATISWRWEEWWPRTARRHDGKGH